MSSSVGYVPRDGGDFLPFLIRFRTIIERPRDVALRELDDIAQRVDEIRKLPVGYGYKQDSNFNLLPRAKPGPSGNYLRVLSNGDPDWILDLALREISSHTFKGLSATHIKFFMKKGYKSILEIVSAPDEKLLDLKGIGPKKLITIRANIPPKLPEK